MNASFIREMDGIYRLKIPFDNIYTSVFLIVSEDKAILVDSASDASDVDNYILPALREMGYTPDDLYAIVLTHHHEDHAGGLERIQFYAPQIKVISEAVEIIEHISIYPLPGHTAEMIGVFDRRTNTLISGDGLQGAGVGKYRCSAPLVEAYLETISGIERDDRVQNILFSHAYEPWYTDAARGRAQVLRCLSDCKDYIG